MAIICVHPSFNDLVGCRKGVPKSSLYKVCVGDDVLICDRKVADQYTTILNSLKVSISKSKSLISSTGCIEFAKRFLVNGLTLDLSPISTRCLSNFFHPYGYYAIRLKYSIRRFSTLCRIGGGRLQDSWSSPQYLFSVYGQEALTLEPTYLTFTVVVRPGTAPFTLPHRLFNAFSSDKIQII